MELDFRPLDPAETDRLRKALRANADDGAPLHMDRATRFVLPDPHDEERQAMAGVINAIKSVPCHYAEMQTYTLPRTGDAPLKFTGELLAYSDGERLRAKEQNRWHDVAVYRSDAGYAVSIEYRTRWGGEGGHDVAVLCRTPDDVRQALRNYDPAAKVAGFPHGPSYADRQARLLAEIRGRYEEQVSEVLSGDAFAVEAKAESADAELMRRSHLLRYRQLLAIGLREAEWTEAEASLICDALNGHWMLDWEGLDDPESAPRSWQWWPAEVEDAMRLNHLDRKWKVDPQQLLGKIRGLSALGLAAVADAAERFWREHADEETGAALRAVGLVRG